MLKKNIPAILIVGMFFFSARCPADPLELAEDLFQKGEWQLCRRECRRAQLEGAEPSGRLTLLSAMASVRTGMDPGAAASLFEDLIETEPDRQITAMASYELGRLQWQLEQPEQAFDSFATAFHSTTNKPLFLHASCSLFLLMNEHQDLKQDQEALISQINTSRSEWYGALFSKCEKPEASGQKTEGPGWFVGFYRSQISPAIGDRCNLHPSCSEYFRQARAKHGLLAFAMVGDRFFREPEVNNLKKEPITMEDGHVRYRDLLEYHDFWMTP